MKKLALKTHKILGLSIALIIVAMGLTGSYLVWSREISPIIRNEVNQVIVNDNKPFLSLTDIHSIIVNNYADSYLKKIVIPDAQNQPYHLFVYNKRDIRQDFYIHPQSGEILHIYQRNNTFDPFLSKFHQELLTGISGKVILGLLGISLLLLTITGLLLWSGWQKLALGFKIRFGSKWRLLNYDLHKVIGILSLVFVANFAVTGAILALDEPLSNLTFFPSVKPDLVEIITSNKSDNLLSLDSLLATAKKEIINGKFTEVNFPRNLEKGITFRFKLANDITPQGKTTVTINPYSSKVISVDDFSKQSWYQQFKASVTVLHYGNFGGVILLIFYFILGIILASLALTGFSLWWGRNINLSKSRQKSVINKSLTNGS